MLYFKIKRIIKTVKIKLLERTLPVFLVLMLVKYLIYCDFI